MLQAFNHKRRVGLADHKGQVHVAPIYDQMEDPSEGLRVVRRGVASTGVLDAEGQLIVPTEFGWIDPFRGGFARAAESPAGSAGLIDRTGAWRVPMEYAQLAVVDARFALARPVGKETAGLLEIATGAWRIEPSETELQDFFLGSLYAWAFDGTKTEPPATLLRFKKGRRFGAMDLDGEVVIEPRWETLLRSDDGSFVARTKKKAPWLRLSAGGDEEHTYEGLDQMGAFLGGEAIAQVGKLWGILDREGAWLLEPLAKMPVRGRGPLRRVFVGKRYGYAKLGEGLVIDATFQDATEFAGGFAIADRQVLDEHGKTVATVDPASAPRVLTPPAPPRSDEVRALIAMVRRPAKKQAPDDVLHAILRLPNDALAALLHAWWTSGRPWIQCGAWQVWTGTQATWLTEALAEGKSKLPFGTGPWDDPVTVRCKKNGDLEIRIESNPDDAAPRSFTSLGHFADSMVEEALRTMIDRGDEEWPPPPEVQGWFDHGGASKFALEALRAYAAHVIERAEDEAARAAAQAWLDDNAPPKPVVVETARSFVKGGALVFAEPPAEVDALLRAGGHDHYRKIGERWFSVHAKGIRFAVKGKRKTTALKSGPTKAGPALAVVGDVALVGGRCEVLRVDLTTGKKSTILTRPYGDVDGISPTADGARLVIAPEGEDYTTPALELLDLEGELERTIALPPGVRFLRGLVPLWDQVLLVQCSEAPLVVDVAAGSVLAKFERGAKEARCDGTRLVLTDWGDEHWVLTKEGT